MFFPFQVSRTGWISSSHSFLEKPKDVGELNMILYYEYEAQQPTLLLIITNFGHTV